MNQSIFPQALTIAGSDSGGGAGIQADLKTFQQRHVFGMSAVTAVTAQNTLGVFDISPIPTATISAQIKAIAEDFHVQSFKMGMLGNADIIRCVAHSLQDHHFGLCVLDPVMIAKGGAPLLQPDAVSSLIEYILPLADVITPNIPEAECLTGVRIDNAMDAQKAADKLLDQGAKAVVIKGGHGAGNICTDYVFLPEENFTLDAPRFNTPQTHGTGCTFSACICAELAKGENIAQAIRTAKAYITAAITHPLNIGHGHGPTNHWAFTDE